MGRRKKKKTYKQSCQVDVQNGNHSKFTKACLKRFPEMAGQKKAK